MHLLLLVPMFSNTYPVGRRFQCQWAQLALVKRLEVPVIIQGELEINTFSKSAAPFSLNFESISGLTYKIEASHDLKKWGEIGEVHAAGSSAEYTDWRKALFQKQYFRVKLVE